jgi:hypothetical protein
VIGTSPEALSSATGVDPENCVSTSFAELYPLLPDAEWGLALSPNVPAGAYLLPEHLREMARVVRADTDFAPVGLAETRMWQAVRTATRRAYLDALVLAEFWLITAEPASAEVLRRPDFPWLVTKIEEQPSVVVFTSAQRMAAAGCQALASVRAPALEVIAVWPDQSCRLLIDPGSPIQGSVPGETVPGLLAVARDLAAREGVRSPAQGRAEPVSSRHGG